MSRSLTALIAATSLAIAAVAAPSTAEARHDGRIAAGVIGGLAAAAIFGGALAHPRYHYGYYGPYHAVGPYPYRYPYRCHWRRQRVFDGFGWYVRRVRVCY